MEYLCSMALGYLLGSISPSYMVGKFKKVDIRNGGTKNLGASNTFIHFGRFWGAFVMVFDIFKAFFSVKLAELIWGSTAFVGLFAGSFAVIGHNYPFYLKFKGGKGLASFGGFVLAVSPSLFGMLLLVCATIAFLCNYGCMLSLSGAVLFPIVLGIQGGSIVAFLICAISSASMFLKHTQNLRRIAAGEETKLTVFIDKYLLRLRHKQE